VAITPTGAWRNRRGFAIQIVLTLTTVSACGNTAGSAATIRAMHEGSGSYSAPSPTAVATALPGPIVATREGATSPSDTVYITHFATHGYPTNARGQTYGPNGPVTGHDGTELMA
jgi:hypothetical protein